MRVSCRQPVWRVAGVEYDGCAATLLLVVSGVVWGWSRGSTYAEALVRLVASSRGRLGRYIVQLAIKRAPTCIHCLAFMRFILDAFEKLMNFEMAQKGRIKLSGSPKKAQTPNTDH